MKPDGLRARRRSRLTLVALVILFAGPVLLAYWLNVAHPGWRPFGQTNHGTLITPSYWVGLNQVMNPGEVAAPVAQWVLLHAVTASCDRACQADLVTTRQIRLSLGKDAPRVVRVAVRGLTEAPFDWTEIAAEHPDLLVRSVDGAWLRSAIGGAPGEENRVVLIDPNGYAVLKYGVELNPKGLAKDLGRLLKISKIG